MKVQKVGIVGGSGYGGSELLRRLLVHPYAEVSWVTAHSMAGKRVDEVHPNLRGFTDLVFQPSEVTDAWKEVDVIFLGLPHSQSMHLVPDIPLRVKIIDLAGDFRLKDQDVFQQYYGEHVSFLLQPEFVYGLTELNRDAVKISSRVACPGCFATATILGLAPMVKADVLEGRVIVDAKTGSSGSGIKPSAGTHHPRRAGSFYAYKMFSHRHQPEIVQALQELNPSWDGRLTFQTHSAPMVRGIFASIYLSTKEAMSEEQVGAIFEEFYEGHPFVRLSSGSPNTNWVKQSNFADIGWAVDGQDVTVFATIDNLVKGASGQAIQNFNVMCGYPEGTGLMVPGTNP